MKVLFLPDVRQYFRELIDILFEKEYFAFEEDAIQYVRDLILEIERSLPLRANRTAPLYFRRYGHNMRYATFRKNRSTVWYVFFTKYQESDEIIYLVRYLTNNHMIAKYL